ncbi:MAG: TauD/TfdA family dioxygenase [Pirellulaceae bacterium]
MNSRSVNHPAVWRGQELLERSDWLHQLTVAELQELQRLLSAPGLHVADVAPELYTRLKGIQNTLENGCGAAMIRGMDVANGTTEAWMECFERIANVVGHPISQSAKGERVFSVRDAGLADNDPRARGPNTKKKLSFHTDRCDVIGFLCLQQAKSGGENQLVSSPALFNEIGKRRPDLLDVLMQPFLYLRHSVDTANDLPYTEQPIFSFFEGHFAANFLRVLIERAHATAELPDLTVEQREALDYLEAVAAEPEMHLTFRQQPGDILFMNNWVTMHRRTAFEDYEELDRRRHILRVWLSMPNSRPLDPVFAGNYGATEAGAMRGGMRASSTS